MMRIGRVYITVRKKPKVIFKGSFNQGRHPEYDIHMPDGKKFLYTGGQMISIIKSGSPAGSENVTQRNTG